MNEDVKMEAALRNGHLGDKIIPEVKETSMGVSMVHRQAVLKSLEENWKLSLKFGADAAVVTSQVVILLLCSS